MNEKTKGPAIVRSIFITERFFAAPLFFLMAETPQTFAQQNPETYGGNSKSDYVFTVWVSDNNDGTYSNQVLFADYSDPDICKAGDDFYMTSSSFNCVPALPILHSRDLVNWTIVNHAVKRFSDEYYNTIQHGNGVWASSIRFHDGWFYIYWGDPDRGIYMVKTQNPKGAWSSPALVKKAYGNIDPCALWDDDGKVYLVHAFANSRAGVSDILQVQELTPDGSGVTRNRKIVFNGYLANHTLEDPKFYMRNGYYYIFVPAGGVAAGWQLVLRSQDPFGPYEERIVLAQGDTEINGPHQGGYVELKNGEGWFVHFQEKQPYGRIVLLQPVNWKDDWPVMGIDKNMDGTGEPVDWRKSGFGNHGYGLCFTLHYEKRQWISFELWYL
jgi:beta-xylosidase